MLGDLLNCFFVNQRPVRASGALVIYSANRYMNRYVFSSSPSPTLNEATLCAKRDAKSAYTDD